MGKTYLGDSVYAEYNSFGQIVLTTENGAEPSNTIYLEPEVYTALKLWVDNYDPTPWCSACGARKREDCHCGPIAENN
jgi:hypothetical protein